MPMWLKALAVYAEPRVLAVLFLGFSSGVPLALTAQTLSVWMTEAGVSLAVIGVFALVGLPYVLKFLWAPFIDALKIPFLTRALGRRRAWLIATQIALMAAVVALGLNDPAANPVLTALLALIVAFCSASQDVAIDAFRVESLSEPQLAAGMANYVAGYRVALLVATAGAFELTAGLQGAGLAGNAGWAMTYAVMAALVGVGVAAVLCSAEPVNGDGKALLPAQAVAPWIRVKRASIDSIAEFISRPQWLAILVFVMLFKFGDAFAGLMTAPFVLDIGFDKVDYGRVVKVFGFAATILGGFAGGLAQRMLGTYPALWAGGLGQMFSNLMFVLLAQAALSWESPGTGLLTVAIGVENFAGGFGTVIFVAYLSQLCRNRSFTATQYALLSALSAVGRTVLSAPAGWLAENLGWSEFFVFSTLLAAPGLVMLWWLARDAKRAAPAV